MSLLSEKDIFFCFLLLYISSSLLSTVPYFRCHSVSKKRLWVNQRKQAEWAALRVIEFKSSSRLCADDLIKFSVIIVVFLVIFLPMLDLPLESSTHDDTITLNSFHNLRKDEKQKAKRVEIIWRKRDVRDEVKDQFRTVDDVAQRSEENRRVGQIARETWWRGPMHLGGLSLAPLTREVQMEERESDRVKSKQLQWVVKRQWNDIMIIIITIFISLHTQQ